MTKKILISTWCTDDYADFLGVEKLTNSIKYFHPEIDHVIFNSEMTKKVNEQYSWLKPIWMMPPSCLPFIDDYDMVIHLDADAVVVGPMDELFNSESDVVGVRNNNSFNKAGCCAGITIPHLEPFGNGNPIPIQKFINAGLVGVNKKEFWQDWQKLNEFASQNTIYGLGDENDTLNQLFHCNKYKSEIIDPIGSKVSYGLSNVWGNTSHWESWSEIYVKEDKLYLDDPVTGDSMCLKVIHQAGGSTAAELNKKHGNFREWLKTVVSKEVVEYINGVTS